MVFVLQISVFAIASRIFLFSVLSHLTERSCSAWLSNVFAITNSKMSSLHIVISSMRWNIFDLSLAPYRNKLQECNDSL